MVKGTDSLKADVETVITGGRIDYKLKWRCVHPIEEVEVMNGEVFCHACDNNDMTGEQEVEILEAYADLTHSVEEDRAIQDA